MIKLKSLLNETLVFPGDFTKEIKRAEKATGKKFKNWKKRNCQENFRARIYNSCKERDSHFVS